jgi:cell division protein FtsB
MKAQLKEMHQPDNLAS